jgi:hypothetical protein
MDLVRYVSEFEPSSALWNRLRYVVYVRVLEKLSLIRAVHVMGRNVCERRQLRLSRFQLALLMVSHLRCEVKDRSIPKINHDEISIFTSVL